MKTKRLQKIVDALPTCQVLADVGCDHGYVGIAALEMGLAQQVVFVDVSAPSLQKARQNCPEGLISRAEFVCQDGLREISADCAVIAGMGGLEIISVLEGAKTLPDSLVLQPMRNQTDVRKWLCKQFEICHDQKFFDGKFYDLIVAKQRQGGCVLTDDQLEFGQNLQNPTADFIAFIAAQKAEYQQILTQHRSAEILEKYQRICAVSDKITEEPK